MLPPLRNKPEVSSLIRTGPASHILHEISTGLVPSCSYIMPFLYFFLPDLVGAFQKIAKLFTPDLLVLSFFFFFHTAVSSESCQESLSRHSSVNVLALQMRNGWEIAGDEESRHINN